MGEIPSKKKIQQRLIGKRQDVFAERAVRHIGSVFRNAGINDIDIVATIRASVFRRMSGKNFYKALLPIQPGEIREKLSKGKISFSTVFLIDSSGSITGENMERLKGLVRSLIQDAYRTRDKVGVVSFRNHQAQKVMPLCPRSHLKQVLEYLRDLPSGGGTPLASGLLEAARLLSSEQMRYGGTIPVIMLISDGRANIPTGNGMEIGNEIRMICRKIKAQGFFLVFIDTDMTQNGLHAGKYEAARDILKKECWSYYHILNISRRNNNERNTEDGI